MNTTGDKIIDALLSKFREMARSFIQRGLPVNLDDCLEMAIGAIKYSFAWQKISEKDIRTHIGAEEEMVRGQCQKIVLEIEKKNRMLDIKKIGVGAILDDLVAKSHYKIGYKVRGNSTVGICVTIPASGQVLRFSTSFKKVMDVGWIDDIQKDMDEFMNLASRFGRMRITD